jgi:hypothetical protein
MAPPGPAPTDVASLLLATKPSTAVQLLEKFEAAVTEAVEPTAARLAEVENNASWVKRGGGFDYGFTAADVARLDADYPVSDEAPPFLLTIFKRLYQTPQDALVANFL